MVVINLGKNIFIILLFILSIFIGVLVVNAYNPNGVGGNPAITGHSVDEIDWDKQIHNNVSLTEF